MALIQITEPGQAVDPHQRKRAAGIDLGTTHSLIASVRAGRVQTLADESGSHLLPSVVRYEEENGISVGDEAVQAGVVDPANTIASIKRLMGRGKETSSPEANCWTTESLIKPTAWFVWKPDKGKKRPSRYLLRSCAS